ncbi:MAG: hypothetical protein WC208_04005 [Gallionella sp.]|jgi:hypothetical protein
MNTKHYTKPLATLLVSALLGISTLAVAQDTVFGEGRTSLGAGDASAIRNAAKQDAIRDAVIKAIKDATALDASDPRFAAIVNEVAKQLRDVKVQEERKEGADFVTRIEAVVDRKQIKNAIRGTDLDKSKDRSFSILMLVDEFVTNTHDLNMPLSVLTESSIDEGASFKDKSLKANASSASNKSAVAASSSEKAAIASSTNVSGKSNASYAAQGSDSSGSAAVGASQSSNYKGSAASAASYSAKNNFAAAASSQSAKSSIDKKDVEASSHLKASSRTLIQYQDTSKPTSKSIFLGAFGGNLRDYDMKLQDSANVRSKFFGDKVISLSVLQNGAEMSKFSEFARTKASADFLMIGNSTVVGGGGNSSATGQISCVVNAEVRAFATSGNELIASDSQSTQASGTNIEECAAIASKKIADLMAPVFAERALGYWADRSARGRQFTVELKGTGVPVSMRIGFTKALKGIEGAADVEKKEDGDGGVKVTLTLKSKEDAADAIYEAVASQAAFAGKNLDRLAVGEQITLCFNKCAGESPTAKGKKK